MKKESEILEKVMRLSGIKPAKDETEEQAILRGLDVIDQQVQREKVEKEFCTTRVNQILDVMNSYAKLDYSHKAPISDNLDFIDALASGINMIGEELKDSTVSLHEKKVMLKEIHHRVKNNLQIISSLLNLQSGQIDDATFKEKYQVSRDRIRSMALVHEKLYESENLALVDFSDYVKSLANSLNVSYNPDNQRIGMNITVNEGTGLFKIETAIPCGLVLNEMLSNSFKYAFPADTPGKVDVFFGCVSKKGEEQIYLLEVKDNGVGIPDHISVTSSETLGFQLITMLSEQLNGQLSIDRNNGTSFSLRFKEGK